MDNKNTSSIPIWSNWKVALATIFVVAVGTAFWLLVRFSLVFFLLFIAVVISTAITPAVEWLHKRGMSRALGVILIYLMIFMLVIAFILLVAPLVLEQAADIGDTLPQYYQSFRDWMLRSPSLLVRRVALELPRELPWEALQDPEVVQPQNEDSNDTETIGRVTLAFTYAGLLARGIFTSLAVFLLAFYWTLEGERILRTFLLVLPNHTREGVREFLAEVQLRVGGYIRGVILLSLIVGSMALVAYFLIGLPYALSLALIAAVMEAVPIIGPGLGALPALLVAFSIGDTSIILYVLGAVVLIQLMENTFFGPRVMEKSVKVNPILTLLALATFTSLLGIPGALLAVPIAAVFQLILERLILRAAESEETVSDSRDNVSALRLELKEFSTDVRKHMREKGNDKEEEGEQIEDRIEVIAEELDRLLAHTREQAGEERRVR
jgi:predicted PurR-regulated permease PerM